MGLLAMTILKKRFDALENWVIIMDGAMKGNIFVFGRKSVVVFGG